MNAEIANCARAAAVLILLMLPARRDKPYTNRTSRSYVERRSGRGSGVPETKPRGPRDGIRAA